MMLVFWVCSSLCSCCLLVLGLNMISVFVVIDWLFGVDRFWYVGLVLCVCSYSLSSRVSVVFCRFRV